MVVEPPHGNDPRPGSQKPVPPLGDDPARVARWRRAPIALVLVDRGVEDARSRLDDLHPKGAGGHGVVDALGLEGARAGALLGDRAEVDDVAGHGRARQRMGQDHLQQRLLVREQRPAVVVRRADEGGRRGEVAALDVVDLVVELDVARQGERAALAGRPVVQVAGSGRSADGSWCPIRRPPSTAPRGDGVEGVVVLLTGNQRVDVLHGRTGRGRHQEHLGVPRAGPLVGVDDVAVGRVGIADVPPTFGGQVGRDRGQAPVEQVGGAPGGVTVATPSPASGVSGRSCRSPSSRRCRTARRAGPVPWRVPSWWRARTGWSSRPGRRRSRRSPAIGPE